MLDVLHMHGIEAIEAIREFFPVVLNGAGGDGLVGGGHLFEPEDFSGYLAQNFALTEAACPRLFADLHGYFQRLGSAHGFYVDHRMRSFTVYGPLLGVGCGLGFRLPFMDNAVQEFLLSVPLGYKADNRLYRQMLLATFPQFFRKIPWQATGAPLGWPAWAVWGLRLLRRLRPSVPLVDYAAWLRDEPVRTWWTHLFEDAGALYPAHLCKEQVVGAWRSHLAGANRQVELGRYATFELLLQQVFAGKWKTIDELPLS